MMRELFIFSLCFFSILLVDAEESSLTRDKYNRFYNYNEMHVTIDYQFHNGRCVLKDGTKLKGEFKYLEQANYGIASDKDKILKFASVPAMRFKPAGGEKTQLLKLDQIELLILAGKDDIVEVPGDSTIFKACTHVEFDLVRWVAEADLNLYDNSFIIDELQQEHLSHWKPEIKGAVEDGHVGISYLNAEAPSQEILKVHLPRLNVYFHDKIFLFSRAGKYKKIKSAKDLEGHIEFNNYLKQAAIALSKEKSKQAALMLLLNSTETPISYLGFFTPIEITLNNDSILKGKGYIQKIDFSHTSKIPGAVHFHHRNKLRLIDADQIKKVNWDGITWDSFPAKHEKKNLLGYTTTINGTDFYVCHKVVNRTTFYNTITYERKNHLVFYKKSGTKWKHIFHDGTIRRAYLASLKSK